VLNQKLQALEQEKVRLSLLRELTERDRERFQADSMARAKKHFQSRLAIVTQRYSLTQEQAEKLRVAVELDLNRKQTDAVEPALISPLFDKVLWGELTKVQQAAVASDQGRQRVRDYLEEDVAKYLERILVLDVSQRDRLIPFIRRQTGSRVLLDQHDYSRFLLDVLEAEESELLLVFDSAENVQTLAELREVMRKHLQRVAGARQPQKPEGQP
jgi:hypothetical protein